MQIPMRISIATYPNTLRVIRRLGSHLDTLGTPPGHHEDTIRTPLGHPTGHRGGNRRTPVKKKNCLDFALATEGSFLSPAHAASPRSLARTNETKRFPHRETPFHFDLTLQPPMILQLLFQGKVEGTGCCQDTGHQATDVECKPIVGMARRSMTST